MIKLAHAGAAHRVRSVVAIAMLALVAALLGATSARAAGVTGPVDASGIPIWYQDATGLQLAPCLLGPPNCFGTLADLNANGGEAFYANANTSLTDPSGASFNVVLAVEVANLNGLVTFGRIRVVGKGLAPNTTYTVNEPYGDITLTSDAGGVAKDTTDIGCGAAPCAFDAALASPMFGGFLQWDPAVSAPPLGFIGDNVTPHKVVGSPIARNFVTITGGGLSLFTDQFIVEGELAAGATPPGMLPPATPLAPELLAADDTGVSHADHITNVAAPRIDGTTRAGAIVTATVDGAVNGTGTALADGTYSIKLPTALADGVHAITVKAANPLSGAASPVSPALTITTDTSAPAAPSAPKTNQPSSASLGAIFNGTAEADSIVSLSSDGDPIGSGPATGGAYSIKASALGTGLHQITATSTDIAGNTSGASQALALPVGSVNGIQAPTLGASSDSGSSSTDGITNVAQPTFVGSVSVTSAAVKLFSDGSLIGTGTATGGSYSITSSSKLGDGQHLITVVITDNGNGLESTPSAPLRITIDTAAPAAPSKPVSAQALTAAGSLGVSGTADAGTAITVFLDGRSAAHGAAASGSWSATLVGLASGSHRIDATATDVAGNTSQHSDAMLIDTGAAGTAVTPTTPKKKAAAKKGLAVVAIGAVPVVRFHGHVAMVGATVTVNAASKLAVSAANAGGRKLILLRGTKLGSSVQRAVHASAFHATLRAGGRVQIELHLDRSQLKHRGLYRIVVGATDKSGHAAKLRIAFRVR
jgi:hypothetical protein